MPTKAIRSIPDRLIAEADEPENTPLQFSLPFNVDKHPESPLIPARILNEFVYCPRLAYLEWVQKEWADSSDTVEGRHVHRRVDRKSGFLPAPETESDDLKPARSIEISSSKLDLVAKIDLIEPANDGKFVPVEYKRGKRPHVKQKAYDPERVQLCAQGMLLEEHGYRCSEGILYFAGLRERVRVAFDESLRILTKQSIDDLRMVVEGGQIPPPLQNSPKCNRCSLVGICMPDEINLLRASAKDVRPIAVRNTHALPVYVQANQAKVSKQGDRLMITLDEEKPIYARLAEVSQLVLMGNVHVTTPTLHELMRREIPITWQSYGGWFLGHSMGVGHANVELRTAQYRASFDESTCLRLARGWVMAKIKNSRVLLRRNWTEKEAAAPVLQAMKLLSNKPGSTMDIDSLLGIEGAAAAHYFQAFPNMFKMPNDSELRFSMEGRNRRPPTDPVNALLSFGYSMLARSFAVALSAVGLDPFRGFFHQPRYGRPALALDMMEPFRSLIVDSCVITVINNGQINMSDFIQTPIGVNLTNTGRKRFIAAFERRLDQEVIHPLFGYAVEYRRLFEMQARLLARFLLNEIPENPNFLTR